jgi:hypothetical protein
MDDDIEAKVWRQALHIFGAARVGAIVQTALANFRRLPGYDPMVRVHESQVGQDGLAILGQALQHTSPGIPACHDARFVTLRYRLHLHLNHVLQWHVVQSAQASDGVLEDQVARDLGL